MTSQSLAPEAQYGMLAFDCFVLEHFDFTQPSSPDLDQQQWNALARRYLALSPLARSPYHDRAQAAVDALQDVRPPTHPEEASDLLTAKQAMVARALQPFQTARERNTSVLRLAAGADHPVWVRGCYRAELQAAYEVLCARAGVRDEDGYVGVEEVDILDDEERYGDLFADGDVVAGVEDKLMLRVPTLADVVSYSCAEDAEDHARALAEAPDGPPGSIADASRRMAWLVYLVDEEVLLGGEKHGLVKVLWMDVHGRCVWENRIVPEHIETFRGALADGRSLLMHLENETRGEGEGTEGEKWQRGAVFGG